MFSLSAGAAAVFASMNLGLAHLAAQEASRDVAFVETVTGRVVAFVSGAPALLSPLDVITDRTRVDLLASSELRVCHYRIARFLTVKGPARIMVSADGVRVETGRAAEVSRETCSRPQATSTQGGVVARGVKKVAPSASDQKMIGYSKNVCSTRSLLVGGIYHLYTTILGGEGIARILQLRGAVPNRHKIARLNPVFL
jgi:hypothetical protein